jgi:hypothetical protein
MKKQTILRAVALVAVVSIPFISASAAGPFQVRRAGAAQGVCTAAPIAVVATSPYDGEPIASGGVSYDYAVYDASGTALDISVLINPVTQMLRIGFDDGNPTSAPVDALTSSVAVSPASIVANGLQVASITIEPRDQNGVLLGRGLAVTIDPSLLWPAQLNGPVVDLGNGSYLATAIAWVPGAGTVRHRAVADDYGDRCRPDVAARSGDRRAARRSWGRRAARHTHRRGGAGDSAGGRRERRDQRRQRHRHHARQQPHLGG